MIVSIEKEGFDKIRIFEREGKKVTSTVFPGVNYILLSDLKLVENADYPYTITELQGNDYFKFMLWSSEVAHISKALRTQGITREIFYVPPEERFMIKHGHRQFKDCHFDDLHRMQIDIEAVSFDGHMFPNADREDDRIIIISISDNKGYEKSLNLKELSSEEELLRDFINIVQRKDPDVLEFHYGHNFDLPFIEKRALRYGIPLALGRRKKIARSFTSAFKEGEKTINFMKYYCYGRHIVDTCIAAKRWDVVHRKLDSYGLKEITEQFGLTRSDRVFVDRQKMYKEWIENPQRLIDYGIDDVRDTRKLSDILVQAEFMQAKLLPMPFHHVLYCGNTRKINSLMVCAYLNKDKSIPKPSEIGTFQGATVGIYKRGVIQKVVKCDYESLYPNIMLTYNIFPRKDTDGIFLKNLKEFTKERLDAKKKLKKLKKDSEEYTYWDAVQNAYKILINSMYGYLSFSNANWNDPEAAAKVTEKGRNLLEKALKLLKEKECDPVSSDTDGIIYKPPENIQTYDEELKLIEELNKEMPKGIRLSHDGRWQSMISYEMKSYALLDYEGHLTLKGGSLRSRSLEKFAQRFLREGYVMVMKGNLEGLKVLYKQIYEDIKEKHLTIDDFCVIKTLHDTVESYDKKLEMPNHNQRSEYELLKSYNGDLKFSPGDKISYYIKKKTKKTDANFLTAEWAFNYNNDEDTNFLLKKLKKMQERFKGILTDDQMREIFDVSGQLQLF